MKYPLACSSWDDLEVNAAIEVIKSGKCTMGPIVKQYEEKFAKQFGSKYAVMSNSGSSANLLAIAALMYRSHDALKPGDEVLVPAVSWATTYYPLHQYGLKMKFVDIDIDSLNVDVGELEKAIGANTKAIFAVNLLGMPNNFERLLKICKKYNLILIEDNCESMGATYNDKQCGTFGLLGTYSSFFSHHICTIEGGVTVTDDEELYQIMISLRAHGWTRELPQKNFVHDKDGNAFNDLFRFVLPGYNLRPNELYAAIGLHQLDKLPSLIDARRDNHIHFLDQEDKCGIDSKNYILQNSPFPDMTNKYVPSWFGFSIVLQRHLEGKRDLVTKKLMENGIDCRPIVAGNFAKNPVIKHMNTEISGNLRTADYIDKNGLFIGNSHVDLTNEIDHFFSVFKDVLK